MIQMLYVGVRYRDKGLIKATAFGVNVLVSVSWRYD